MRGKHWPGLLTAAAVLAGCSGGGNGPTPGGPEWALNARLSKLEECGIKLRSDVSSRVLLQAFDGKAKEVDQYRQILLALGEAQEAPQREHSEDVVVLHLEELRRSDAKYLAGVARRLADGDLPLQGVDIERKAGQGFLVFTLDGKKHRWPLSGTRGTFTRGLLARFAGLLEERGAGRRLYRITAGTAVWIVGCGTTRERQSLLALNLKLVLLG